jgi:hypothetical protein
MMTELGRVRAPGLPGRVSAGVLLLLSLVVLTPASVAAVGEPDGGAVAAGGPAVRAGAAVQRRRRMSAARRRRLRARRLRRMEDSGQRDGRSVPAGQWGGEHILLNVTGRGGSFELDCAHGSIDEPLAAGGDGSFDVRGRYVRERGGPEIAGRPPDSYPARLTGRVDGARMTLRIVLSDSGETAGEFTLERGREPRLTKCL